MTHNSHSQAMMQQLSAAFTSIPFNRMLGLQLDHLDKSQVTMSFAMKNELIGNFLHGILHGGVISSVLDMAGGMVVMAAAIEKLVEHKEEEIADLVGKCITVDLQISYLRQGRGDHFVAKAYLSKYGKNISFTRMELLNQDDLLLATGNGTYLLRS